jgi:hypothetical protein
MKTRLTILLFILHASTAVGQDKILSADSDTLSTFKYFKNLRNKIGLEPIQTINSDFYFSFWDGIKVIELRQIDGKMKGTVTFFLQQYKRKKEGRIYFTKTALMDKTTDSIHELVTKFKIIEIPTDNQIKGWGGGLDGITYVSEFCDNKYYSFKTYWTPDEFQDKLSEARQLIAFIAQLDKIKEINEIGKKFMYLQPFSSWYSSIGGAEITTKIY